jgi:hypothetical protein
MKYIFKQIDNISGRSAETTVEFSADYLPDILEQFEMFLRGSGFHFSGTLDFVSDEEYYGEIPDFESKAKHQLAVAEMLDELCHRCGLTKNQLGDNICYDMNCGLKE